MIERSKEILAQLEDEHLDGEGRAKIARRSKSAKRAEIQLTLFSPIDHPLLDDVRRLDLNNVTPLAALQLVKQWQETLAAEKKRKP